MRIKRIEIIGFKSFFDKTVLDFDEPITGVVGPNGCGKSNIVDAIRWCMGEQSAKHLRGKAMEDVIFAGSENRGAAGMAQVSLTFENVGFTRATSTPIADVEMAIDSLEDEGAGELAAQGLAEVLPEGVDGIAPLSEADLEAAAIVERDEVIAESAPAIDYSQYGEVTVTRRLFRDGTSEYYINKTVCRLRDITDFFLGTGVGTKAYSIIEQGRIGMIVSAKPEERRVVIEEAAGITKFKKKKQSAERKMDQTRQNLLRVSDVVSEIEKQLGSLRRQAQKAERYKKYRTEVRDIDLWSASHRYLKSVAQEQLVGSTLTETTAARDEAQVDHLTREAKISAERVECAVEEKRLSDLTERVFELENRIQLGDSQIEFQSREGKSLEDRVSSARGEIEGLSRQLDSVEVEIVGVQTHVERLDSEAGAQATELSGHEQAQHEARGHVEAAQKELDAARAEIAAAQTQIARAENNHRALERRRGDLELRLSRVAEEEGKLGVRDMELLGAIGGLDNHLGSLRQLKLDLGSQRETLEQRLAELKDEFASVDAEVETLRTELHRRRSRWVSLTEIQDRYEGFARGTRAVMKHRPGDDSDRHRIRGLVADIVEASAEYEPVVEAVLGDRLGSIVVDDRTVGVQAIDFLKRSHEGRSTFIPMGYLENRGGMSSDGIEVVSAEGVRGPLLGLVRCKEEYAPVADYLFSDVVVVDSLPRALELWETGVRKTIVTLEGDILDRHGAVTGGSRETAGAGVLQQKREIRELEEICEALERDLADASSRQVACKADLSRVTAALEALRRDSHEGEMAMLSHEKDLARFRSESERLAERRLQLEREHRELEGTLGETGREEEETSFSLEASTFRASDAERRQLGLIEGVTDSRRKLDEITAGLTACKVRVAQVNAERTAVRTQLGRLEERERELTQRLDKLTHTIDDGTLRVTTLHEEVERLRTELLAVRDERRAKAEELAAGRGVYEQRMAELKVAEVEVRGIRSRVEKLLSEVNRLEMELSALLTERRHIEESVYEHHRTDLRRELCEHHMRPPVGEAEEARLRELRELIERMGEINLTAIEEFEELSKRYEFLTSQKKDLEDALDKLEKAIAKINRTSRKLFRETFDAVNAKFQEVFPRLFRGGRAELRLTGDDDLLEAGVEILAQPPGKKNTTVDLLSGGEKALTAVSLIFAIFLIKPSPFCLLDEVDAPLDEANVDRYNELVREMTDRSQFIVITHNKRTMEIADRLYGVTMEEPGCSKLVSVNLRVVGKAA